MNKKLTLILTTLTVILGLSNCTSLNVIDPKKEISSQIPNEKAVFFINTNLNVENEKINSITLNFFDLLNSEISGHTLSLKSDANDKQNSLTGCYLFTGKKTVYAFSSVDIKTNKKSFTVSLNKDKDWFIEYNSTQNPIYAGSINYTKNELDISDAGFKECKEELKIKYPSVDFSQAEELLKKKKKK
jgi:hypothetical protein